MDISADVTDQDLVAIAEKLGSLDVNNVGSEIVINTQSKSSGCTSDVASSRLVLVSTFQGDKPRAVFLNRGSAEPQGSAIYFNSIAYVFLCFYHLNFRGRSFIIQNLPNREFPDCI
jgi:hypothetical protein